MPFDFTEDAAVVIDVMSNADVIVGSNTLRGIFHDPSKAVSSFDLAVVSTAPSCTMKLSDVAANGIDNGTVLTINGINYEVAGAPEHDGAGLAVLALTEAP